MVNRAPAEAQRSGFGGKKRNEWSGWSFRVRRQRNKRNLFRRDPGFVGWVGPEPLQPLNVLRLDLPLLSGRLADGIEVGEGVVDDIRGGQPVQALLEPVSEDGCDAENLGTRLPPL